MNKNPTRVLLVTELAVEQSNIPGLLSLLNRREFILAGVTGENQAIKLLAAGNCDACIIDLPLTEAVVLLTRARRLRVPPALLVVVDLPRDRFEGDSCRCCRLPCERKSQRAIA